MTTPAILPAVQAARLYRITERDCIINRNWSGAFKAGRRAIPLERAVRNYADTLMRIAQTNNTTVPELAQRMPTW
jgi:hypothetical protein